MRLAFVWTPRKLEPGDVFVAIRGAKADGLSFAPVAAARPRKLYRV